jgi:hypothetical protein
MYPKVTVFVIFLFIFCLASYSAEAQLTQLFGCNLNDRYSDLLIIDKGDAHKTSVVAIDILNLSDIDFESDGTLYGCTNKNIPSLALIQEQS